MNSWVNDSLKLFNRALSDLEFLVKEVWLTTVAAVSWVFHWLWILAMSGWLWFLWRRALDARALMNEALDRCQSRPAEERGNAHLMIGTNVVSATLDKYLGHDLRDKWLESGRDLGYKLRQIAGDRRGWSLIAFYAATHGLFAGLLLRLLVNC